MTKQLERPRSFRTWRTRGGEHGPPIDGNRHQARGAAVVEPMSGNRLQADLTEVLALNGKWIRIEWWVPVLAAGEVVVENYPEGAFIWVGCEGTRVADNHPAQPSTYSRVKAVECQRAVGRRGEPIAHSQAIA